MKSVLGILTLGAGQGAEVVVRAKGRDAGEALDAIRAQAGAAGRAGLDVDAEHPPECGP
jgi:phosphotransferase system HPr-like phosphotransfer protein